VKLKNGNFYEELTITVETPIFCLLGCSKTQHDKEFGLRQTVKQLKSDNPSTNFRTGDMLIQFQMAQGERK